MKKIPLTPDPAPGIPETPEQTIARLTARNQELEAQVAAAAAVDAARDAEEEVIAQKIQAGLTREQAISVIKHQKAHDKAIADKQVARRPAIVEILKQGLPAREMRQRVSELDASITPEEIKTVQESLQG